MSKQIIVAKYGGFCFGVKRAVDTAIETADKQSKTRALYSYGPLIHNEQVISLLEEKGLAVVDDLKNLNDVDLIIRSHGVAKSVYEEAELKNINVIDTTCIYVKRVHDIVQKHSKEGYFILILGNATHPEIIGIKGWCGESMVIDNVSQLDKVKTDKPICVVAQTTFNTIKWQTITNIIKERFKEVVFFNTICSATVNRQREVSKIADEVDYVIVIGGKKSSNTRKLYEIASKKCKNTQLIQKKDEINVKLLEKYDRIGIVAGASTPDWVIDEVIQILKSEGEVVFNGKQ